MEKEIFGNFFKFWQQVGAGSNGFFEEENYKYIKIADSSWPRAIYDLKMDHLNLQEIALRIKSNELPNAMALIENPEEEKLLKSAGFVYRSHTTGMFLEEKKRSTFEKADFSSILPVKTIEQVTLFSSIASGSFNHQIPASALTPLLDQQDQFKLFLGYYEGEPAFCGMLYFDEDNVCGMHLIGTLTKFRGRGLASTMTQFLIKEALKQTSAVILLASKAGRPIYEKYGFVAHKAAQVYHLID